MARVIKEDGNKNDDDVGDADGDYDVIDKDKVGLKDVQVERCGEAGTRSGKSS